MVVDSGEDQEFEEETYKSEPCLQKFVSSNTCIFIASLVLLVFLPLFWFPFQQAEDYPPMTLEGENFAFDVSPFWYQDIKVSTDAPPETQGLYYFSKCPKPNIERNPTSETHVKNTDSYSEGFYMNDNSIVFIDWNATTNVTFSIYVERALTGTPKYAHKNDDSQRIAYTAPYSDYFVFDWRNNKRILFDLSISWEFSLMSYDTTLADQSCPLGKDPCHFEYRDDSSCVVVDYYNMTSEDEISFETITMSGRGGKYFGIVMVPVMILCCLMGACYCVAIGWRARKEEDEERKIIRLNSTFQTQNL